MAAPTRPPEKQDGLFDTGLRDPALFWETLAQLGAIVGDDRVGTPALSDTHRPDTFVMERPAETVPPPAEDPLHPPLGLTLRRFRPPWPARVMLAGRQPAAVESGPVCGPVRAVQGPWRVSGGWWTPERWSVETWHVELPGGLYQLGCTAEGWRVEGVLD